MLLKILWKQHLLLKSSNVTRHIYAQVVEGQKLKSKVLVIGAGGSPVSMYLAAASGENRIVILIRSAFKYRANFILSKR
jgi:shikimate 5-dehydrogenase